MCEAHFTREANFISKILHVLKEHLIAKGLPKKSFCMESPNKKDIFLKRYWGELNPRLLFL